MRRRLRRKVRVGEFHELGFEVRPELTVAFVVEAALATTISRDSSREPGAAGVSCIKRSGAFYAFPNVNALGVPSSELAHRLLSEAGLACLSGTDFGTQGEGYLRFSYAASLDTIDEAIVRMRRFLAARISAAPGSPISL